MSTRVHMRSTDHRRQLNRSSRYLLDCRRRYIRRAYGFLVDPTVSAKDRNAAVNKMAKRMMAARLYTYPKSYNPDFHPIPKRILHGISSHLHREWRARIAKQDAAMKARGDTPPHRPDLWSWNTFCAAIGWNPFMGTIASRNLQTA